MKLRKLGMALAIGAVVALLALVGCSSSSGSSSASTSGSGSVSASAGEGELGLLEDGKLYVATSPDYPPFENLVDGEHVGLDMELAQAIATRLNLEVEWVDLEFSLIIPAIQSGGQADIGLSGFSVDPERAEQIAFSDAYYTDDIAVAVMKGGAITTDNAKTSLNDPSVIIAVQLGTTGEAYAKENFPNATIKGFQSSTDCFAEMQAGNANAVCTNLSVVSEMIAEAYADAEVVYKDATSEDYAAIVSQDNPALLAAVNGVLAEMKADGSLDALLAKYIVA